MILRIQSLEHEIKFTDDYVNVFEINNAQFFYSISQTLYNLCNKTNGTENIELVEGVSTISIPNECLFFDNLLSCNFVSKNLTTKLTQYIAIQLNLEQELCEKLDSAIEKISFSLSDFIAELDESITTEKEICILDLIKLLSPTVYLSNEGILTKLCKLISLISMLKLGSILILLNVKLFFSQNDLQKLYQFALHKRIHLLLIENVPSQLLPMENKLTIDADMIDKLEKM